MRELARRGVDRFGRIDTWVNNAGLVVYRRFEEVPAEVYRHVIDRRPRSTPGKANGVVSDHRE